MVWFPDSVTEPQPSVAPVEPKPRRFNIHDEREREAQERARIRRAAMLWELAEAFIDETGNRKAWTIFYLRKKGISEETIAQVERAWPKNDELSTDESIATEKHDGSAASLPDPSRATSTVTS